LTTTGLPSIDSLTLSCSANCHVEFTTTYAIPGPNTRSRIWLVFCASSSS
jgi:hypothetical protein